MFLKYLYIKNFRNIPEAELDFENSNEPGNRKWTFILGENGTGKSNLLKAIAIITAGSDSIGEILGNIDQWIRYGQKKALLKATIVTAKGEERYLELILKKGATISHVIKSSQNGLKEIDDALGHTDRNYFVVGYGANRKLAGKDRYSGSSSIYHSLRSNNIATLFNRNAILNSLDEWASDLDYKSGGKDLNLIKETLNDFLPKVKFDHIDKENKCIIFKTEDGKIPLDRISDGYQSMASLIGDILYRVTSIFKDRKEPLSTRGILLIDEIELHLHPRWQRELVQFLVKTLPNFQIICTTHSPLTAQQANEGELYLIKRPQLGKLDIYKFKEAAKYLPLSELIVSPIFGLETDESLELAEKKQKFKKLSNKKRITKKEKIDLALLKEELMGRPLSFKSDLTKEQFDLLTELRNKK